MQKITVATNHRTACGHATVSRDFSFPFNSWFDVGAGFQAAVSKDFYAYGDVEYRFGNDLWNTWVFNVGAKYRF